MALSQIKEPKGASEKLLNIVLSAIGERKDPAYQAIGAHDLGTGVIAVQDSLGETDIYFDPSMWDYADPNLWQPNDGLVDYKSVVSGAGLLPGNGRFPPIADPDEALDFARDQLVSTTTLSVQWLSEPKTF